MWEINPAWGWVIHTDTRFVNHLGVINVIALAVFLSFFYPDTSCRSQLLARIEGRRSLEDIDQHIFPVNGGPTQGK